MTSPPGWYPDPTGEPRSRFWDGTQWSSSTQPLPVPRPPRSRGRTAAAVTVALVVVLVVVALGGVGLRLLSSGGDDADSGSAAAVAGAGPCAFTPDGAPARPVEPPSDADLATSGSFEVELATSAGRVVFVADAAQVPCALASLRSLARQGYYDSSPCHRLTTGGLQVLQCGDPTGTGSGGPGYAFDDEALTGATYPRGTVAMANAGPGTNGSQFFLVYADAQLPPSYTPLGRITEGLEVVERVAAAGSDDGNGPGDGRPRTPVQLETVTVREQ